MDKLNKDSKNLIDSKTTENQNLDNSSLPNFSGNDKSVKENNNNENTNDSFDLDKIVDENEEILFKHQMKSKNQAKDVDNNNNLNRDVKNDTVYDDDNEISSFSEGARERLETENENSVESLSDEQLAKIPHKSDYNGVKTDEIEINEPTNNKSKKKSKKEKLEEEEDPEYLHKKKILKVIRRILYVVCIMLVSILLAVLIIFGTTDYFGMFRPYYSKPVNIPAKSNISQIADKLQKEGIIRSSFLFKTYIDIADKGDSLQTGTYALSSEMSYHEIIKVLKNTKNRATAKVTIPEGYTVPKIAELLEKKGVCKAEDFLIAANNEKPDFDFSDSLPTDKKRLYNLEGYLFPDTYEFYMGDTADSVVKKMLNNFDSRIDDDLRASIKKSGMSIDDVVNLASIIQAETGGSDQMNKVSSVFHNRIKNGYQGNKMLQSDVTVLYGKNVILPALGESEATQKMMDAYSTYKVKGLPEGPINNPGKAAIIAAISPEKSSNYFFVTDKKGNFYYARTFNQHKANCQKALKNGAAEGTATSD